MRKEEEEEEPDGADESKSSGEEGDFALRPEEEAERVGSEEDARSTATVCERNGRVSPTANREQIRREGTDGCGCVEGFGFGDGTVHGPAFEFVFAPDEAVDFAAGRGGTWSAWGRGEGRERGREEGRTGLGACGLV